MNTDSLLTKCVRQVRIRLSNKWLAGAVPHGYDTTRYEADLDALLQMLELNRSLEHVDMIVSKLGKKRSREISPSLSAKWMLDQLMLINIFAFVIPPVLRQVVFRSEQELDFGRFMDEDDFV
ncbi:hypothetical protein GQ600_17617 [Phytophthora cactorum]|nr:hypothetical protein GQ600_17617 [Phytophthora cactorum]